MVKLARLMLGALALQGCLSSSTYADVDLGGSSIDISSVNLAADGKDAAAVTLALRQSSGAPVGGLQVQVSVDHGAASASSVTDAAGITHSDITSLEVGQHTLNVAVILPNGQSVPLPLNQVLNFYTPGGGGVPVAVPLNAQAAVHGSTGEVVTHYTGTVHFVSDDPQASLPAPYTFKGTEKGFKIWLGGIVLRTAGHHSVDVVDTDTGTVLTHQTFDARAGGAATLQVQGFPSQLVAGDSFTVSLAAFDGFGNPVPNDGTSPIFQSSDPTAAWTPGPVGTDGVVRGQVTLTTAGTQLVQWNSGSLGTGWLTLTVAAGGLASLHCSAPTQTIAGSNLGVSVRAADVYGNTVVSFADQVHLSSSDGRATLAADSALQQGSLQVPAAATLLTAGPQTLSITASPSGITATVPVTVLPAAPAQLVVASPASLTAGQSADLVVGVQDTFGNTVGDYAGTLVLHSSDAQSTVPAQVSLSSAQAGSVTVPFSLHTMGQQQVAVSDALGLLASVEATVAVSPAAPAVVRLTQVASPLRVGQRSDVALAVQDIYSNAVAYVGTLTFSSSDPSATLPTPVVFTGSENGVVQLPQALAFARYGQQWVQVSNTAQTVTGRLSPIDVHGITQVAMGSSSVCAVLDGATLKCWGSNLSGQLGLGDTNPRGLLSGQMGAQLPAVDLGTGRNPVRVAGGNGLHFCALLDNGQVKCWGHNTYGELGLGDTLARGTNPNQMGDNLPAVSLGTGRTAVNVQVGYYFSCALLDNAQLKCWGAGDYLGNEDPTDANVGVNPNQMGDNLPPVNFGTGRTVASVWIRHQQASVILDDGTLKNWGGNWNGGLGLGDTQYRGDQPGQMGDNLPAVSLGSNRTAQSLAFGYVNECALLDDNTVKCWGADVGGALGGAGWGTGSGGGQMGDNLPTVNLGTGRIATALTMGQNQSCVILDDHTTKCWGPNANGELGLGDKTPRGDNPGATMGDNLPTLSFGTGRTAVWIGATAYSTCVLLDTNQLKCWGVNSAGQLGLGDQINRGQLPNQLGDALPETILW